MEKQNLAGGCHCQFNISFGFTLKLHIKVKGKAIPLQAWTDPEGSRRLRLPDFKTVGT
jgi:hypothetical protein